MDGYQFRAGAEPEKPGRWMYLLATGVIVGALVWLIATSHFHDDLLPNGSFAGCYISSAGDPLELDPSGALLSRGAKVGTFKVIAPVGGKHGPLISVDQTHVRMTGSNVYFERGQSGYFWPVTQTELQVSVYPPGELITFQKANLLRCR